MPEQHSHESDCPHPLEACRDGRCHMCGWIFDERVGEPFHILHHDAQDDQVAIGCYDVGVRPGVVFDGGCFIDPAPLRAFAADLVRGAAWLEGAK